MGKYKIKHYNTGGQIGTGIGTAVGSFIPVPGASAITGMLGGMLGSRLGRQRQKTPVEIGTASFKYGGNMKKKKYPLGGQLPTTQPIGPGATRYEGPSHEQGGIPVGETGQINQTDPVAEVEGGETRQDDYIFSDELTVPGTDMTFAEAHELLLQEGAGEEEIQQLMQLQEQAKQEQGVADPQEEAMEQPMEQPGMPSRDPAQDWGQEGMFEKGGKLTKYNLGGRLGRLINPYGIPTRRAARPVEEPSSTQQGLQEFTEEARLPTPYYPNPNILRDSPRTMASPYSGFQQTPSGGVARRDLPPQPRQQTPTVRQSGVARRDLPPQPQQTTQTTGQQETKTVNSELSFGQAFAQARKQGLKEFTWRGNKYHTRTAEEEGGAQQKKSPEDRTPPIERQRMRPAGGITQETLDRTRRPWMAKGGMLVNSGKRDRPDYTKFVGEGEQSSFNLGDAAQRYIPSVAKMGAAMFMPKPQSTPRASVERESPQTGVFSDARRNLAGGFRSTRGGQGEFARYTQGVNQLAAQEAGHRGDVSSRNLQRRAQADAENRQATMRDQELRAQDTATRFGLAAQAITDPINMATADRRQEQMTERDVYIAAAKIPNPADRQEYIDTALRGLRSRKYGGKLKYFRGKR